MGPHAEQIDLQKRLDVMVNMIVIKKYIPSLSVL